MLKKWFERENHQTFLIFWSTWLTSTSESKLTISIWSFSPSACAFSKRRFWKNNILYRLILKIPYQRMFFKWPMSLDILVISIKRNIQKGLLRKGIFDRSPRLRIPTLTPATKIPACKKIDFWNGVFYFMILSPRIDTKTPLMCLLC